MDSPDDIASADSIKRLAEAAAWRSYFTDHQLMTSAGFEEWLANDPANAGAWARVETAWNVLGSQAASRELIAARRAALDDARRASSNSWRRFGSGRGIAAIAASFLVAIVAALVWFESPEVYSTKRGERHSVTLADGSRLALDSATRVRVSYSRRARELELVQGQARFDVSKDVQRPFSVSAGDRKIVATGTAFNVDLTRTSVIVTLIEGHVVVLDTARTATTSRVAPKAEIQLRRGEQLAVVARGAAELRIANVDRVIAWQAGQLIFEDETLAVVVERISRYTRAPVTVADDATGDLRISGVFNAGDLHGFVDAVSHYLPVTSSAASDGAIRLAKRAPLEDSKN